MTTNTYEKIASVELTSSASSITFSSLPQNYRDLVVYAEGAYSSATTFNSRLNGDSGTNYQRTFIYVIETPNVAASAALSPQFTHSGGMANPLVLINFLDYSQADKYTTVISRANDTNLSDFRSLAWLNTSPVTSIEFSPNAGTFSAGFKISMWGVVA